MLRFVILLVFYSHYSKVITWSAERTWFEYLLDNYKHSYRKPAKLPGDARIATGPKTFLTTPLTFPGSLRGIHNLTVYFPSSACTSVPILDCCVKTLL